MAIVDTNCSPDGIDYIVPGNDDALRAVRLFAAKMADAIIEGQQMLKEGGAEVGEIAEGAEAVAPETPREKSERRERGRGRGERRGQRRTTYVPPGAPSIPDPGVAVAPEAPMVEAAHAAVDAGEAASIEATSATIDSGESTSVARESHLIRHLSRRQATSLWNLRRQRRPKSESKAKAKRQQAK